jgi:hypothetical protein
MKHQTIIPTFVPPEVVAVMAIETMVSTLAAVGVGRVASVVADAAKVDAVISALTARCAMS